MHGTNAPLPYVMLGLEYKIPTYYFTFVTGWLDLEFNHVNDLGDQYMDRQEDPFGGGRVLVMLGTSTGKSMIVQHGHDTIFP